MLSYRLKDYTILDTSFENRDITSILKEFSERSLEKVFDSFTIRKSPGPHGGKRQTGRMKSKFNFSSLVIPVRCARISPVKPSHDYANSGIIYFSFAPPFPSYPPRNRATPASTLNPLLRWWAVTRIEQLWSAQGFWCSHQLFHARSPCKAVNHALGPRWSNRALKTEGKQFSFPPPKSIRKSSFAI